MGNQKTFTVEEPGRAKGLWSSFWRLASHALAGSLTGYLLLHPASILLHHSFERHTFSIQLILRESLSPLHLPMALYFTLIGTSVGVAYGIYHLRIAQLYEQVKNLSVTDPLTALYNRRYLMDKLNSEVDRCRRYGRNLSIIMADIDHFKKYNDTHGHQQGDELLRMVAGEFRRLVRKPDFVARYGGEEFAVVMPETDCQKAVHLAERIRESIGLLPAPGVESQTGNGITVSIGIAELPAHAADITSLIKEADDALYRAKSEGRDRVVACENRKDQMTSLPSAMPPQPSR
jgi:diguanylate cyclase (GGDEF)-like protein